MGQTRLAVYILATFMTLSPAWAEDAAPGAAKQQAAETGRTRDLPADAMSQHVLGKGDSAIRYTATAGTLPMTNDKGDAIAKVFYIAYTTGAPDRPLSFVFNGGPGAASAFSTSVRSGRGW